MGLKEQERKKLVAENAKKQLVNGTWPQVMMVFGYKNPRAARVSDDEYARLKALYEQAACPNMAMFLEHVRFQEKERGVTMSFNLSMRHRVVPGDVPPTMENAALLLFCPDILVGTRNGVEGAAVWFRDASETMSEVPAESFQVMDKIFGEAIEHLKSVPHETTVEEMVKSTFSGGGMLKSHGPPSKH